MTTLLALPSPADLTLLRKTKREINVCFLPFQVRRGDKVRELRNRVGTEPPDDK